MQEQAPPPSDKIEPAKRPYEPPKIIDYGTVQSLTRGTGSLPTFDMMSGTRRSV